MVVYVLEKSPQRLRGVLSRYCLEIRAGLFVGRLDAKMRELLWEKIETLATTKTTAAMVWRTPTEQGYSFKQLGCDRRDLVQIDGIWLVEYEPENAASM